MKTSRTCLRADVSDALLICGASCITVFRDHSGRFGYFDSHCRTSDGLPADENTGTAVMLTFSLLEDLVQRLLLVFQWCFDLRDQDQFDLLPVSFMHIIPERCQSKDTSLECQALNNLEPFHSSISTDNTELKSGQSNPTVDSEQCVQVTDPIQWPCDEAASGDHLLNEENQTDDLDLMDKTNITDHLETDRNVPFRGISHNTFLHGPVASNVQGAST